MYHNMKSMFEKNEIFFLLVALLLVSLGILKILE